MSDQTHKGSALGAPPWIDAALALLVLAPVAALTFTLSSAATVDGRARALARKVHKRAGPADLVLLSKADAATPRHRGRALFAFRPLAAVEASRLRVDAASLPFERLWLAGEVDPGRLGEVDARGVDDDLRLVELGDPARLLVALYDPQRVQVVDERGARPCKRPHRSGGVACSGEDWHFVGPRVRSLGGHKRLCLWAHPPAKGAHLQLGLRWPEEAPARALDAELQFVDKVRGETPRDDVELRLLQAGGVLAQTRCNNTQGHCRLRSPVVSPGAGALSLDLWTPHNGRQLVCLTGGLVAPRGAAP